MAGKSVPVVLVPRFTTYVCSATTRSVHRVSPALLG